MIVFLRVVYLTMRSTTIAIITEAADVEIKLLQQLSRLR
jgi:hypothetical protein